MERASAVCPWEFEAAAKAASAKLKTAPPCGIPWKFNIWGVTVIVRRLYPGPRAARPRAAREARRAGGVTHGRGTAMRRGLLVFACATTLALPESQPVSAAAQETPRFGTGSEVVVLDVVVRDKKGRTVRDIRPDELVVLEDGVPQEILSFRLRAAGEAPGEAEPAAEAAPPANAAPEPAARRTEDKGSVNLVTLVFDQLGLNGRAIARRAGLALAGLTDRADLLVSVFTIREKLGLVQQFKNEHALVEAAVQAATSSLDTGYLNATALLEEAVAREAEARRRLETAGG